MSSPIDFNLISEFSNPLFDPRVEELAIKLATWWDIGIRDAYGNNTYKVKRWMDLSTSHKIAYRTQALRLLKNQGIKIEGKQEEKNTPLSSAQSFMPKNTGDKEKNYVLLREWLEKNASVSNKKNKS